MASVSIALHCFTCFFLIASWLFPLLHWRYQFQCNNFIGRSSTFFTFHDATFIPRCVYPRPARQGKDHPFSNYWLRHDFYLMLYLFLINNGAATKKLLRWVGRPRQTIATDGWQNKRRVQSKDVAFQATRARILLGTSIMASSFIQTIVRETSAIRNFAKTHVRCFSWS